jgi:hypothetical protein
MYFGGKKKVSWAKEPEKEAEILNSTKFYIDPFICSTNLCWTPCVRHCFWL